MEPDQIRSLPGAGTGKPSERCPAVESCGRCELLGDHFGQPHTANGSIWNDHLTSSFFLIERLRDALETIAAIHDTWRDHSSHASAGVFLEQAGRTAREALGSEESR